MSKEIYTPTDLPYHPFNFYKDRLELAKSHGYKSVVEAFRDLYRIYQSTRKVGKMMGITPTATATLLKKIGVELLGPGGKNHRTNPNTKVLIRGCKYHGTSEHYVSTNQCRQCMYEYNNGLR